MSALPYLCMWIFGLSWGVCMDRLAAAGLLSVTAVRRLSTGFGASPVLFFALFLDSFFIQALVCYSKVWVYGPFLLGMYIEMAIFSKFSIIIRLLE